MTKAFTKLTTAAICFVAVLALFAKGSSADTCDVDSTDPESMNCNSGPGGSAGMAGGMVYESLTAARVPVVSGLSYDFYDKSCPKFDNIIRKAVSKALEVFPLQTAGLTRIMFHDCFIQGCDASLLLTGSNSEQSAVGNQNLRQESFDLIQLIKSKFEQTCPNTVSCADILMKTAAEAIKQAKGPKIKLPVGRRDGTSMASSDTVNTGLPVPIRNVSENFPLFSNLGLDYADFVALTGAHTLGVAHCNAFRNRLSPTVDAGLDANFANTLTRLCPANSSNSHPLDDTPNSFDNKFFKQVLSGDVLLTSDDAMDLDGNTANLVKKYARSNSKFEFQFARSFVKMSQLGVLTGSAGEIRRICSAVN